MNFRKLIFVLFLTTITMFVLMLGFSYAWYATATTTNINIMTPSTNDIVVDFKHSRYIYTTTGMPILDANAAAQAESNVFSVKANENMNLNANYTVQIKNISIATELKTASFKWRLLKNDISIANGSFADIGSNTSIDLYTATLTNTIDNYKLLVWLSETNISQNELMNKQFSGTVTVKTTLTY